LVTRCEAELGPTGPADAGKASIWDGAKHFPQAYPGLRAYITEEDRDHVRWIDCLFSVQKHTYLLTRPSKGAADRNSAVEDDLLSSHVGRLI
jgi:hypothetical protein